MRLTRRSLLAAAAVCPVRGWAAKAGEDPVAGARLYRDIEAYSALGEHRTATECDIKTSQWLAAELERAGLAAERRPFRLRQFSLKAVRLEAGGKTIQSFPAWWPKATGAVPVTAKLALYSGEAPGREVSGAIAVFRMPEVRGASLLPGSPVHPIIALLAKAGAVAAVGVSQVESGELMALNAMAGPEPWPIPFVLAGKKDEDDLKQAAAAGASGSVLIDGSYNAHAEAFEVVGRLQRSAPLIVVSTPYSGWFHCAGERGPGIALWLGLARRAAARKSEASWVFVASSGHELSGVGIHSFVERDAPKPGEVACWLHLGAGIATYDFKTLPHGIEMLKTASPLRKLYTAPRFERVLRESFSDQPDLKPIVTEKPGGEMILMAQRGYPVMGFAGGSAFHHMPGDLPARITGPELLEPVGRDLVKALGEIESSVRG